MENLWGVCKTHPDSDGPKGFTILRNKLTFSEDEALNLAANLFLQIKDGERKLKDHFLAALIAAQRFFMAIEIRLRPACEIFPPVRLPRLVRFLGPLPGRSLLRADIIPWIVFCSRWSSRMAASIPVAGISPPA